MKFAKPSLHMLAAFGICAVTTVASSAVDDDYAKFKRAALPSATPTANVDTTSVAFSCGRFVVRNDGAITLPWAGGFEWTCAPEIGYLPIFNGSFMLAADSGEGGAVVLSTLMGYTMFAPREAPYSGDPGLDEWENVPLGYLRQGGCPGTPDPIVGEIVAAQYTDSLEPEWGLPQFAGVDVIQTVVSTSAYPYGDFSLFRWEIINHDTVAKSPWHAGSFVDWDITSYSYNVGRYSDACNGYYIWDPASPGFACGMLDPNQPARYRGTDPSFSSPHRIWVEDLFPCYHRWYNCWGYPEDSDNSWWRAVNSLPMRRHGEFGQRDYGGVLINSPIALEAHGSASIHQALFYVDASTNDPAVIEANAVELAHRAARWAGFARGDVNDDGLVDLADVCWLHAGLPIYPDDYSGDINTDGIVDAADVTYLMNFVSGNGPGPMGEWRFEVPPAGP